MKAINIMALILVLALTSVTATIPTGFHLDKQVLVTGDWAWQNNGWVNGDFPTASFVMDTDSNKATSATYMESEVLGKAWKYNLEALTTVNAKTSFDNTLNVITVNPPTTTAGTAWTYFDYGQLTAGDFSTSGLSISGYGNLLMNSLSLVKSPSIQQVTVDIN